MRLPAEIKKVATSGSASAPRTSRTASRSSGSRWWLRLLSSLPLPAWYGIASFLAFIIDKRVPKRATTSSTCSSRPASRSATTAWIRETRSAFYRNFADVSVEIIKAVTMKPEEVDRRVRFENDEPVRAALDAGQSVVIVTSHNCNWEWALLKLSIGFGHPMQATYKPLKGRWGDSLMMTIRSRFGAEMITAKRLLIRVMRYRGPARIIGMVTDQAPTSSGVRYFTQFMGLDTAFFVGPGGDSRSGKLPVFYVAMRRDSRGHYCMDFVPIATAGEELAHRRADRALCGRESSA